MARVRTVARGRLEAEMPTKGSKRLGEQGGSRGKPGMDAMPNAALTTGEVPRRPQATLTRPSVDR